MMSPQPRRTRERVLTMTGIGKRFGAVKALTDVDFWVNEGEVVALVGDNGAGKSTLVKVLAGVHPPDAGTIFLAATSCRMATEVNILFIEPIRNFVSRSLAILCSRSAEP